MKPAKFKFLFFFVAAFGLSDCGAPAKSADEVSNLFKGDSQSLAFKIAAVCATLDARASLPNFSNLPLASAQCPEKAGLNIQNYVGATSLQFENIQNGSIQNSSSQTNGLITLNTRAKVWLNKTLLNLAQLLSSSLSNGAPIAPKDSGNLPGISKLANITVTKIREPRFDTKTKEFNGEIRLVVTGVVKVDQTISISGKIIDNNIAVQFDTINPASYEQSLIESFHGIAMIIPYEKDVYVDLMLNVNAHSIGLDKTLADQMQTALSSGLKTGLDTLMNLK